MQILVVEDNEKLNRNISEVLGSQKYSVTQAYTGEECLKSTIEHDFDMIILDLNLPDFDGIKLCQLLRTSEVKTPILMLTARIDIDSKVNGLDSGADDYLSKPFLMEELLARVRTLLRRDGQLKTTKVIIRDIEIDLISRRFSKEGKIIDVSSTESQIIQFLLNKRGVACSTMNIYESVWGDYASELSFSDTLKVHIARIRKKFGKDFIETINGLGYKIP